MEQKMMTAAVFKDKKKVELEKVSQPDPEPREVLIKIKSCLICTWEQRVYLDRSVDLPFIPGHEAAGEVVRSEIEDFTPGDKVTFKTLDHCGYCYYCQQGYENQCIGDKNTRKYDDIPGSGGLAEYISLPADRVFPLSKEISFEEAAFAEPLACCIHSIKRADIGFGNNVLIFGAGIMGQLHAILARLKGARVFVVEPQNDRRQLAENLGTHYTFDPGDEKIKEFAQSEGFDAIILTTKKPELAEKSAEYAQKMTRIIFYGSFNPNRLVEFDPNNIHYSEVCITGSSSPATLDFRQSARLLSYGIVPVKDFISERFQLDEIQEAMDYSINKDNFRVAVKFN